MIYFADTELSRITQKAARNVMLGGASTMTQAQFKTSLCANIVVLFTCNNMLISLKPQTDFSSISTAPPALTFDVNGKVTNAFPYNAGANGNIMVLQVMYLLPVISGPLLNYGDNTGNALLVSTVVFVNEPQ